MGYLTISQVTGPIIVPGEVDKEEWTLGNRMPEKPNQETTMKEMQEFRFLKICFENES